MVEDPFQKRDLAVAAVPGQGSVEPAMFEVPARRAPPQNPK
jgi:hypothetical protein